MAAPDSFDEYVAARYAALLRTAYLLTTNRHDAEDLVQTALMKAVPAWKRIDLVQDALPAKDQGKATALGGLITMDDYAAKVAQGDA